MRSEYGGRKTQMRLYLTQTHMPSSLGSTAQADLLVSHIHAGDWKHTRYFFTPPWLCRLANRQPLIAPPLQVCLVEFYLILILMGADYLRE